MALQISQETFNSVVLENIQEFEMSPEEAVEDAIKQFEAQGVNLMMIIKDSKMFSENGLNVQASSENELLTSLNDLTSAFDAKIDQSDLESRLSQVCANIQRICKQGIAERCLATKVGASGVLIKCIMRTLGCDVPEDCKGKLNPKKCCLQTLNKLLETYSCYVESQPDVMDASTMDVFVPFLGSLSMHLGREKPESEVVQATEVLLEIFTRFCFMHEDNRQALVKIGVAKHTVDILEAVGRSEVVNLPEVATQGCLLLRALVADDDIRVAFGHSHEHCQVIVGQCDALPILFSLLKRFARSPEVAGCILSTIGQLVVREEFCLKVSEMGGVGVVMGILRQTLQDGRKSTVLKSSLQLLKNLSGSDKVKVEVMSHPEGPGLLCETLERHMLDHGICEAVSQLVASLALRHPDHGRMFIEENSIHDLLAKVMALHEKVAQVQKSCSMVVRNIASRNPTLRSSFLEVGTEELLRRALARHSEHCRDEVSYALRDLGCEVQLRELWKGTGKNLAQ